MRVTNLNILANYLGTFWSALVQIMFVPLYIHFLGIAAYGLIGFYTTLQVWLLVLDFGLTPTINRELARYRGGVVDQLYARTLFVTFEILCGSLAVIAFLIVAFCAHWISTKWINAKGLSYDQISNAIILMGIVVVARWMTNFYRGGLSGLQRQVWMNMVAAIFATLRGAGVIAALVVISPTITTYFTFQAVASVCEAGVMRWGLSRSLPTTLPAVSFQRSLVHQNLNFATGMMALSLLAVGLTQIDKILLIRILPLARFGVYALASTVANALLVLVAPVFNALSPRMVEQWAQKDEEALLATYHRGTQLISILVLPAAGTLALFGQPLVSWWSKNQVLASNVAPLLTFLAIGTAFNCLAHMPFALQLAHGWTRLAVTVNSAAIAVLVPVLIVYVPIYGGIVGAIAWAVLNILFVTIQVPLVHARVAKGHNSSWFFWDVGVPALATAAVLIPAYWLFAFFRSFSIFAQLCLIVAFSTAAIGAASLVTPTGREILRHLVIGQYSRPR